MLWSYNTYLKQFHNINKTQKPEIPSTTVAANSYSRWPNNSRIPDNVISNVNAIFILFLLSRRSAYPTDLFVFGIFTPQEFVKLLIMPIVLVSWFVLEMSLCCEGTKSGQERLSFTSVFFWTNLFVRTDTSPSKLSVISGKNTYKI